MRVLGTAKTLLISVIVIVVTTALSRYTVLAHCGIKSKPFMCGVFVCYGMCVEGRGQHGGLALPSTVWLAGLALSTFTCGVISPTLIVVLVCVP